MGPGTDRDEKAEVVLQRIKASGAEYGDVRIVDSRTRTVRAEDRRIAAVEDARDSGLGVRVLYRGAWGFAATSLLTAGDVRRVSDLAIDIAKASARTLPEPVRLCEEPVHVDSVSTSCRLDLFEVPLEQQTALLLDTMEVLHEQAGVMRSSAELWARRDQKIFASTERSRIQFDLLAVNGNYSATSVVDGRFASRSFSTPYLPTGYELILESAFLEQAARVAQQAVEKVRAPAV